MYCLSFISFIILYINVRLYGAIYLSFMCLLMDFNKTVTVKDVLLLLLTVHDKLYDTNYLQCVGNTCY